MHPSNRGKGSVAEHRNNTWRGDVDGGRQGRTAGGSTTRPRAEPARGDGERRPAVHGSIDSANEDDEGSVRGRRKRRRVVRIKIVRSIPSRTEGIHHLPGAAAAAAAVARWGWILSPRVETRF
jgi:hypothetical protein